MAKVLLAALLVVGLCTACTKLPFVNAPREKSDINLVQFAHYHSESKIRYMVSNDDTHIYLRFDTDNRAMMARIRRFGATVRFDTLGKKKGQAALTYPVYAAEDLPKGPADDPQLSKGPKNLFPPSTTAIWNSGGLSQNIDLGVNAEGLVCEVSLDDMDVLNYRVGVPFTLLGGKGPADFPNLNMELEIPSADAMTPKPSDPSNSSMPSPGSMGNTNMQGNMPGNNMPGNMGTGMPQAGSMSRSTGDPSIRIWMEVKLSK
jgi:hypothetical protein